MSDPVSLARAARENLARGLAALQNPAVPPQVMIVAEPIAQAMSALHRVESTHGGAQGEGGAALHATRQALAMLQQQPPGYAAVDQALEAIASSLSLIHQLAQSAPAAPQAPFGGTAAMPPGAGAPPAYPAPAVQPAAGAYPPAFPQPAAAAYAQPAAAAYAQPAYAHPAGQQQPAPPAYPQAVQPPFPQAAPTPYNAAPVAPAHVAQASPAAAPAHMAAAMAPTMPAGAGAPLRVDAELGAHSSTNFYKGLSGNDVIESGGIFVATYQIPEIGRNVLVKVSMPGGYEFEALGVVRWTREAPLSGSDAPPGFGAQFTQISPEGRQLVYRYVRNREPLFHDDL
jgi:hypothetical protein